jgi:hypothetical protein
MTFLIHASHTEGFPGHTDGVHMPGRHMGQLDVHGAKRMRTWTKLNSTAYAGTNFVITSEPVDFQPGESVILTGSEDTGRAGYEELTVLENVDHHTIYFEQTLIFTHRSEIVTIEGRIVDIRCEIGLLSRNVIIQGDKNSPKQLFGVHTAMFMQGIYRMENAEIRHCGQSFNFGKYCTHSHRGGDMSGSYVKANSIHHSFQRAVTTHDTNNWEVSSFIASLAKMFIQYVHD